MTKSQIKAELRRSACEDIEPWRYCKQYAWDAVCDTGYGKEVLLSHNDTQRTFFLLVAEAL